MINLESEFSPRVNPADANYPFGSIKDNTSPGANDGTPLAAAWGNDWEGFAQAAMTEAGIIPSGLPDTAQDSQLLDAVKAVTSGALRNIVAFSSSTANLVSDNIPIGALVALSDRDSGVFLISQGGTPNGIDIIGASGSNTAVYSARHNPVVKVTHFGADGVMDDTAAFIAAATHSSSIFCPNTGQSYKLSTLETLRTTTIYGSMDGKTEIETIGSVNNPMFFNRVTGRKLAIKDLTLIGSSLNGVSTASPHFRGAGVWCSAGELEVTGCNISGFSSQAIWTGNISDNWDINVYVDRCDIHHNVIDQGDIALGLGDCVRLERTNNLSVTHNECSGGLSGIRSQLFCKDVEILHNHVYGSYADVGITVAHSSDVTLSHNDCHNHHSHGMEVDSSYRVKVDNNKCHQNDKRGILVSEYKTPTNPWYAGYLDGALIAPGQNVWPDLNDISNNMCFNNGESGLHIVSPSRCTASSNKFRNNCRLNPAFTSHILIGTSVDSGYSQDVSVSVNEYTNSALCSAGLRVDSYQYESLLPVTAHNNVLINGGLLSRQPTYGSSNKIKFGEPLERFTAGYLTPVQNQGIEYKNGYSWRLLDLADPGQKNLTFNVPTVPFVRRLLARVKFSGVSSTCRLIVQEYFVDSAGVETFKRTLSSVTFSSTSSVSYRSVYVDSTANNDYNTIKVQFVTDDDAGATVDVHDMHLSWVE